MATIDQIRLDNVRKLAASLGGPARFARKIGKSQSQVSQFMGRNPVRRIGSPLAREIESRFDLEQGWLDVHHGTLAVVQADTPLASGQEITMADGQRMWISPDGLAVVRAFEALPKNERDRFKRKIETAALPYMAAIDDDEAAGRSSAPRGGVLRTAAADD